MTYSIIMPVYNAWAVACKAVDALVRTVGLEAELIFVDNHGPNPPIRRVLGIAGLRALGIDVSVVDRGHNLGCHGGWNDGFAASCGEYVVKLDDDTVMETPGWLDTLSGILRDCPQVAFVAADSDVRGKRGTLKKFGGHELELHHRALITFNCVMFRRSDVARWGPMRTAEYRFAGSDRTAQGDRLYGGEEAHYAVKAMEDDLFTAYCPAVRCHHLGNEGRHPDYPFWKRVYGFYGWTDLGMEEWIRSGDPVGHYQRAIEFETSAGGDPVLIAEMKARLERWGGGR